MGRGQGANHVLGHPPMDTIPNHLSLQELIAIYDKTDFQVKRRARGQSVEKLDFEVSSGVSLQIMAQNLNAVASLMGVDHTDTRIFLGNVCLAWYALAPCDPLASAPASVPAAAPAPLLLPLPLPMPLPPACAEQKELRQCTPQAQLSASVLQFRPGSTSEII